SVGEKRRWNIREQLVAVEEGRWQTRAVELHRRTRHEALAEYGQREATASLLGRVWTETGNGRDIARDRANGERRGAGTDKARPVELGHDHVHGPGVGKKRRRNIGQQLVAVEEGRRQTH